MSTTVAGAVVTIDGDSSGLVGALQKGEHALEGVKQESAKLSDQLREVTDSADKAAGALVQKIGGPAAIKAIAGVTAGLAAAKQVTDTFLDSAWYFLRYPSVGIDDRPFDAAHVRKWLPVTSYIGGNEHAVLHLLYARFWHKVLHDLGHVSSEEPFHRLFNQGYIQAHAYRDPRGQPVPAAEVVERDGAYEWRGEPVTREYGKMGKSLKNVVTPDEMYEEFGADTFRLYEMSMGPLDQSRAWNTRDVVGMQRFLQRVWRNVVDEDSGEVTVADAPAPDDLRRALHRTIAGVRDDMEGLRFNTAIAKLIELNNALTLYVSDRGDADASGAARGGAPREVVLPLVQMLAPLCPHVACELWERLGRTDDLTYAPFPVADPAWVASDTVEVPVQVNGKVRSRVVAPTGATDDALRDLALADERVRAALQGAAPRKVIVVPGRLVNLVV